MRGSALVDGGRPESPADGVLPGPSLNTGYPIPWVGVGLARIPRDQVAPCVSAAVDLGYRHFDTAQKYANEQELGGALRASDLPREDFFVCTKLHTAHHRPRACARRCARRCGGSTSSTSTSS